VSVGDRYFDLAYPKTPKCMGGCGADIDGMCSGCVEGARLLDQNAFKLLRAKLAEARVALGEVCDAGDAILVGYPITQERNRLLYAIKRAKDLT